MDYKDIIEFLNLRKRGCYFAVHGGLSCTLMMYIVNRFYSSSCSAVKISFMVAEK